MSGPLRSGQLSEAFEADLVSQVALMKLMVLICSDDAELFLNLDHILEVDGFRSELAVEPQQVVPGQTESADGWF